MQCMFECKIGDWMSGIGLYFSKVRSFLDTNVNWIFFNEDASNVDFGFFGSWQYELDFCM